MGENTQQLSLLASISALVAALWVYYKHRAEVKRSRAIATSQVPAAAVTPAPPVSAPKSSWLETTLLTLFKAIAGGALGLGYSVFMFVILCGTPLSLLMLLFNDGFDHFVWIWAPLFFMFVWAPGWAAYIGINMATEAGDKEIKAYLVGLFVGVLAAICTPILFVLATYGGQVALGRVVTIGLISGSITGLIMASVVRDGR